MVDRQPTNPGRVRLNPVSGQPNVFDMSMADGATEQGTPLNKATFLKDATTALYGLPNTAVPDDVFAWLGKYNEHYWRRRTITIQTWQEDMGHCRLGYSSKPTISYSENYEVDAYGKISLVNPSTMQPDLSGTGANDIANLAPCYIKSSQVSGSYTDPPIIYLPSGSTGGTGTSVTIQYSSSELHTNSDATIKAQQVYSSVSFGVWEFIYSSNENAYPHYGRQDGYEYEYLGIPFEKLPIISRIETGSYVGTGIYDMLISLSFSFPPKCVMVFNYDGGGSLEGSDAYDAFFIQFPPSMPTTLTEGYGFGSRLNDRPSGKISEDRKTLFWQHTEGARYMYNRLGKIYRYIAIG